MREIKVRFKITYTRDLPNNISPDEILCRLKDEIKEGKYFIENVRYMVYDKELGKEKAHWNKYKRTG